MTSPRPGKDVRRVARRMRRRERCRVLGAWLQCAWLPGLVGLAGVTALGVIVGGPGHRGMPMAWTPLVSIFTGMLAGGLLLVAFGTVVRIIGGAACRQCIHDPLAERELARRAAEPLAKGERLGRWRVTASSPVAAAPVMPATIRSVVRLASGLLGIACITSAGIAAPAVIASRGGGADLVIAALTGIALVLLALRPGPRAWCAEEACADAGELHAVVMRRGSGRPGRRRLIVLGSQPGSRPRCILAADLPGWPHSAVVRHRLAGAAPSPLAEVIRGRDGAVPGDPALPEPMPASQTPDSASSAAMTDEGSVRGT